MSEPVYSRARVAVSIGGPFRDEWDGFDNRLAGTRRVLEGWRNAVFSAGEAAGKVAALPPERRILVSDQVASGGLDAIKRIHAAAQAERERLQEVMSVYEGTSKRELRSVNGSANEAFGAAQIRDHVRSNDNPHARARALVTDPDACRAILSVSPAASGLTKEQWDALARMAEQTHRPDIATGRAAIDGALAEMERSARVAADMIGEASGLVRRGGSWGLPYEE